jgi:hypothetical protein
VGHSSKTVAEARATVNFLPAMRRRYRPFFAAVQPLSRPTIGFAIDDEH